MQIGSDILAAILHNIPSNLRSSGRANGNYRLVKADPLRHAQLSEALEQNVAVEGALSLDSVEAIQRHLTPVRADAPQAARRST